MNSDNRDRAKSTTIAPVRPELVAAKLAAVRNYEYPELLDQIADNPRLVELVWFLQAMSMRPGGLLKFTEDLLAEFPERIGTATLTKADGKRYSTEEKIAICRELPTHLDPFLPEERDVFEVILTESSPRELAEMGVMDRKALEAGLKEFDAERVVQICREAAIEKLPGYFAELCTEKSKGFGPSRERLWYFHDVIDAVFEYMDRWAARVQKRLAMTEVAKLVFDRLDYALKAKKMVRIEGSSRFGKTEALAAWTDMRPGLARLVRVPCDNSMNSFFKRIGEALGIDCSYGSSAARLKERVEYIIQHSGLFLALDEAHFLVAQNYGATSAPNRLNWVRTEIVDRGLPLALIVTPQSFSQALDRFVRKTGYNMDQFLGRQALSCPLPDELSEADLIAVARIHFPELGENALDYIANEARLSQNYLQAVDAISSRAKHLASLRNGRVSLKDVKTAVKEVLGRRISPAAPEGDAPETVVEAPKAPRPNVTLMPRESTIQRAGMEDSDPSFSDRSLRGAGPERTPADAISAES